MRAASLFSLCAFVLQLFGGCASFTKSSQVREDSVIDLKYQIISEYPHDTTAFTQGLVFDDGIFYESTGMWNESDVRQVVPESGVVLKRQTIEKELFGEGLALVDDRLIQLTWQAGRGFVYDKNTLERIDEFTYSGEGWGLTFDEKNLIMSDGSDSLRFLDPNNFSELRRVAVTLDGQPLEKLNELEFVNGEIFANVWQTDTIVRINPLSGKVTGRLNLSGILELAEKTTRTDVLNGIAYDKANDIFYITGKYWSKVFALRVSE